MAKRIKEGHLSGRISSILHSAPEYGEEDDDFTKVQQVLPEEQQSDSGDEISLAQFRKINIELLDAEDKKYAGVRSSRRDVEREKAFGSDSSDGSDLEIDTGSIKSEENDSDEEGEEDEKTSADDVDDDLDESSSNQEASGSDDSDNEQDDMNGIAAKVVSDIEKGKAITNQFGLWDSLLECRIKFQKCLTMANKLPQSPKIPDFKTVGGDDFINAQKTCQSSVKNVLNSMLNLQKVCLNVNTSHFNGNGLKRNLDDEEITSESDDAENVEGEEMGYHKEKKRRKLQDFSNEIMERHTSFLPFRNETIDKWNDKTRVTQMGSKDFSAFQQSTLKQIEMVLADKQRLLKRTRTKRSNYHILGEDDEGPPSKVLKNEECSEIFDDDDFYHQLLRELLERKTCDVTDPLQLSRQWIQLQKARSKMKKAVDTKASKGRKLRYGVHQKLVNFMMPVENTTWTDEARLELIGSLFGKKKM